VAPIRCRKLGGILVVLLWMKQLNRLNQVF